MVVRRGMSALASAPAPAPGEPVKRLAPLKARRASLAAKALPEGRPSPRDLNPYVGLFGRLLKSKDGDVKTETLVKRKCVMVFFGADFSSSSRTFTQYLAEKYDAMKEECEVVFVSSDRNEEAFDGYVATMPWLVLPYKQACATRSHLRTKLKVDSLPGLCFLNEMGMRTHCKYDKLREYCATLLRCQDTISDLRAAAFEKKDLEMLSKVHTPSDYWKYWMWKNGGKAPWQGRGPLKRPEKNPTAQEAAAPDKAPDQEAAAAAAVAGPAPAPALPRTLKLNGHIFMSESDAKAANLRPAEEPGTYYAN